MSNYWASSPYPHEVAYPKMMFHQTEPAREVKSPDEEQALGPEWSSNYADHKRAFPKMKFRAKPDPKEGEVPYETAVVATPEDESKLGSGWGDAPPSDAQSQGRTAPKK